MRQEKAFLARSFLGVLVLMLLASGSSSAQGKKLTLGYSAVGPAGTGLWMEAMVRGYLEGVAAAYRALK
jgi:hypothetical protein